MNDINNIDLNLLKSLYALLAECHVGRAANRMHVTQPALDLFEDLSQTLSDINELIAPKVFDPALANGKFTINTHDFVATSYLPPRIKEIQRLAPKLNFDIQTLTKHSYEYLDKGDIDLIIGSGLQARAKFIQKTYFHEKIMCLLDKAHPAINNWRSETIFQYPHIQFSLLEKTDDAIGVFAKQNGIQNRKIGLVTGSLQTQPAFLFNTQLIAFVPETLALSASKNGDLVAKKCPFDLPVVGIKAIWHERNQRKSIHYWVRSQLG